MVPAARNASRAYNMHHLLRATPLTLHPNTSPISSLLLSLRLDVALCVETSTFTSLHMLRKLTVELSNNFPVMDTRLSLVSIGTNVTNLAGRLLSLG